MEILKAPHPMLHTICRRDFVVTLEQIGEMLNLMRANNGLGLAAPQVGFPYRLFITAWGEVFVDPKIVVATAKIDSLEGCLSLPGEEYLVQRHAAIQLNCGRSFNGMKAIVIQHELDHLNGTLISDKGVKQ